MIVHREKTQLTVMMTLWMTVVMVVLSSLTALPSTIMATLKVPENWTHAEQDQVSFCVEVSNIDIRYQNFIWKVTYEPSVLNAY